MHVFLLILTWLPGVLAAFGVLIGCSSLGAASAFLRAQRHVPQSHPQPPSISILKPVKGLDPGMIEALRSHCVQQYGAPVEILCGVQSLQDPSVLTIQALAGEFPQMRLEVVETPLVLGSSGKVSNLMQLLPKARHELVLISDADIEVGPRYLQRITAPFAQPGVGLVTAPYRGRAQNTLGSRLEALTLSTDFIPGVLLARIVDRGVRFGLGSTLLVSRPALAAIGGLEPLADVLADDYELGNRIAAAGMRVELSAEVVSTSVPAYTFREFWQHQTRWARTMSAVRPGSYFGIVFTFSVPWAILYLVASGGSLFGLLLFLLAVLTRMTVALRVGYGFLRDENVLRDLFLLPLRDCVSMLLWVWGYAGDTVEWRGQTFRVQGGRMHPLQREVQ